MDRENSTGASLSPTEKNEELYHVNKAHRISIIQDGSIPEEYIQKLIEGSYELIALKKAHFARNRRSVVCGTAVKFAQ